jgi:hypothetical protein
VIEIVCVSFRVSQSQVGVDERNLEAAFPAPSGQLLAKRKNLREIMIAAQ